MQIRHSDSNDARMRARSLPLGGLLKLEESVGVPIDKKSYQAYPIDVRFVCQNVQLERVHGGN
jgi:hypothetical protein